jgi:hypothetical protein
LAYCKRINKNILQNKRAEYGKQIVPTLSTQLENKYGRNFTEKNVRRMLQFAEQFADKEIVVTLSRQLSWSHFSGFTGVLHPFCLDVHHLFLCFPKLFECFPKADLERRIN